MGWVAGARGYGRPSTSAASGPSEWDWEGLLKTVATIFPLPAEFEISRR